MNEAVVVRRQRDEFGGADDVRLCAGNDLEFARQTTTGRATDAAGDWRESFMASTATPNRRPTVFAAKVHERPTSASGASNGEVVCGARLLVASRTSAAAADDQRSALFSSLQQSADGFVSSSSSSAAAEVGPGMDAEARGRLLSHAQTSSHSHRQQQNGLHQLQAQNSLSFVGQEDYQRQWRQWRQQRNTVNHCHHQQAMLSQLTTSDNWPHRCRDHTLQLAGRPPAVSSGTFATEGGVAEAASSLVARPSACRCPCHLSPQCCAGGGVGAAAALGDRLLIRSESSCDYGSCGGGDGDDDISSRPGSYRICIKLPQRANSIVVCRRPQLHFATEIHH